MVEIKAKVPKGSANAPQKHLHSRISYLYQAATYLTLNKVHREESQSKPTRKNQDFIGLNGEYPQGEATAPESSQEREVCADLEDGDVAISDGPASHSLSNTLGTPCHLLSHVRAISRKSQIRLSPAMKHSICKRCSVLQIPGSTSTSRMENNSRGGKKPWADVLVTTCSLCGTAKRFPVGAKRKPRRSERSGEPGK